MPPKTTREVESVFTAKDATTQVVNRMNAAVGSFAKTVDSTMHRMASMGGLLATVGAAFGAGASIAGAKSYLNQVERITTLTGDSANNVAGMLHAMEQSGLAGAEIEQILIAVDKKQADIVGGSKEMANMAKRYGLDMSQGPAKVLDQMAKSVAENKLGAGEIAKMLEASGPGLANLMDMLKKGPDEVSRLMAEGRRQNEHINDETIAQFKRTDVALARVKQAWTRITTIVATKLMPVVEKMAISVESRIDGWTEAAGRFGNFMVNNMSTIITMAKTFGKIMLVNSLLMKTTGTGLLGTAGKIGGFVRGGGAAATAAAAVPGMGAFGQIMLKIAPFFKMLGRLVPLVAVVTAIVAGVKLVLNNIDGARERIMSLIDGITSEAGKLAAEFMAMFGEGSPLGTMARVLGEGLVTAFSFVLTAVKKMVTGFRIIVEMISSLLSGELVGPEEAADRLRQASMDRQAELAGQFVKTFRKLQQPGATKDIYQQALSLARKAELPAAVTAIEERFGKRFAAGAGVAAGAPGARPTVTQDFRNSRFEITQRFAEGFDPDRIAVAFANDLGALGERRLQSGLAPLGAIR